MRLIDADALIEEALTEGAYGYVDAKQIADAPTINVVPVRHGRWKKEPTDSFGFEPDYICSVCKKYAPDDWHPKYCPNCGARMDGG